MKFQERIAISLGALAVLMGAFGAHAASHVLSSNAYDIYRTAAHYHLLHSVLLFAAVHWRCRNLSFNLLLSGMFLFSGSLYAYAWTQLKPLALITPIGGVALVAGWLSLLFGPKKS